MLEVANPALNQEMIGVFIVAAHNINPFYSRGNPQPYLP
jgi:hypothetical protein